MAKGKRQAPPQYVLRKALSRGVGKFRATGGKICYIGCKGLLQRFGGRCTTLGVPDAGRFVVVEHANGRRIEIVELPAFGRPDERANRHGDDDERERHHDI